MTIARDKILEKVRALLSKTTANGCTEAEALAALAKARAMMDAYEVTEADLALSKEEAAIFRHNDDAHDPHDIKSHLATTVATFCDCKCWRGHDGRLVFCGLRSDADMAAWMTDALAGYVLAELTTFLAAQIIPRGERRLMIKSFVMGACNRIVERLRELIEQSRRAAGSNSRALVVVKTAAIDDAMKAAGIELGRSRTRRRTIDRRSFDAGRAAGDNASFGKPVAGGRGTIGLLS